MKYEASKRKNILVVLIGVILILCIGLFVKNRMNTLNNASINEESIVEELDDNLIGAYIQQGEEYVKADTIPTSGYEFNAEESYCKIGDAIQEDMTLFYDMDTQTLNVAPLTTKGTKCYLYFDEQASAGETILASANAPTNSTTDWTNNGQGVTYYYTGNPNNWVQFAGFYWRIIRINGDGTIRMIYQGTDANTTGSETQIGTNAFNDPYRDVCYIGFKYTRGELHGLSNNSTILGEDASNDTTTLNGWYRVNLLKYTDYIDGTCGKFSDISIYSLHKMLPYKNGGMIRINNNEIIELEKNDNYYNILEYDLKEIAKKRKRNAMIIEEELENVKGIKILRKTNIYENQTPQTYPILILEKDKNYFYHRLNNEGFGVVSLYHTMIKELQRDEYKLSTEIGMKILNLPVHQDANEDELRKMCEEIKQLLGEKHEQK